MKLTWLDSNTPFPPVAQAFTQPNGLLAAGADLSISRLTQAYSQGIFPWYSEGEPLLWWSPNPRMVLCCDQFSPSSNLRKLLRKIVREKEFEHACLEVRVDTAFDQVLTECVAVRIQQGGTWITPAMQQAYLNWHRAGGVHSVEVWKDDKLVGGLYGVSLGRMFFGESMFTRISNASKIALAYLVRFLQNHAVEKIDCQQQTAHLASLGAIAVERELFMAHVKKAISLPPIPWKPGILDHFGQLIPLSINN